MCTGLGLILPQKEWNRTNNIWIWSIFISLYTLDYLWELIKYDYYVNNGYTLLPSEQWWDN